MKASIKIREDQRPILRAKVPLNILGFPFRSGIEAGDSKELCLSFSTLSQSGPMLKLFYRPNDSWRPFGFAVKTGIGHFGSPIGAPITMSAEFNFLGDGNPSFFLHFKPQVGDFSIKRSVNSQIALPSQPSESLISASKINNDVGSENDKFVENTGTSAKTGGSRTWGGLFSGWGICGLPAEKAVERFFSCGDVCARTALPLRDRAVVRFRWGVRFPVEDRTAELSFPKIPYLVLSKIGVEHLAVNKKETERDSRGTGGDVAESCLSLKRGLDKLQVESGLLKNELEELQSEISAGKVISAAGSNVTDKSSEFETNGGRSLGGKRKNKERAVDRNQ